MGWSPPPRIFNHNATITRDYIWLAPRSHEAPVDLPLGVVDGVNTAPPTPLMVHADHLGCPIRMTDAAKSTQWQATFEARDYQPEQDLRFLLLSEPDEL